jgi:hypothetical protein
MWTTPLSTYCYSVKLNILLRTNPLLHNFSKIEALTKFVFKNFVLLCQSETICIDLKIMLQPEEIL